MDSLKPRARLSIREFDHREQRDALGPRHMLEAAYLCANHEMTQPAIAQRLGISQSQVSRLLAAAERRGVLERRPVFKENAVSADLLRRLGREFSPCLEEKRCVATVFQWGSAGANS